jgi:hypothetical protein
MKHSKKIAALIGVITVLAGISAAIGIFSSGGPGPYEYETIRGETVMIYGEGAYRHMSADVAPQGIAQDVITLFVAIPALLIAFVFANRGSLRARYLLTGILGYFLVTYLFYLVMAMYNVLFLTYVVLLGISFFAFSLSLMSFKTAVLPNRFSAEVPVKLAGGFLIFNTVSIMFLWLGVVVPPLLDGSVIPLQVEHYTTLIVQGLDMALLLPICFVSAVLFLKRHPMGYLLAPVYLVFLTLMMMALTSKIIAMGMLGQNIFPVIVIIPTFMLASGILAWKVLAEIRCGI